MPYSEIRLATHAFIHKSELSVPLHRLRASFTCVSRFAPEVCVSVHEETDTHFGFPLHYRDFALHTQNLVDERSLGEAAEFRMCDDFRLRDYQEPIFREFLQSIANGKTGFLLNMPTGTGKCFGAGTTILMYDGSIKPVEDVCVGDLLMGPDSKPRRVESLARGQEQLYRVVPVKGVPYVVNESHILSLRMTGSDPSRVVNGCRSGEIVNLPVREYLSASKEFRHCAKGWRAGVDFQDASVPSDLPPYLLGLWLGDGDAEAPTISNADKEVADYLSLLSAAHGYLCKNAETREGFCPRIRLSSIDRGERLNKFLFALRHFGLLRDKHIPHCYKVSSRKNRLALLAGLVDTDGSLTNGIYDLVFKEERLAEDIAFVARSLGLAAYVKPCEKTCTTTEKRGRYFRLQISGDLDMIPCRVVRKRADPRRQRKNVLNTGIRLEKLDVGEYYGFTLSGPDRLFLLGDFTVAHNTSTCCRMIQELGRKTLVIVPRVELVSQWAERLLQYTDLRREDIGLAQQDVCDFRGKKVVIGMVHSLSKDKYTEEFKNAFGLVVWDEVHVVGAQTFSATINMFPAKYRIGMSATLSRKDGLESVYNLAIGQVRLSGKGTVLVQPMVFLREFATRKRHPYLARMKDAKARRGKLISELASDLARNALLATYAKKFADSGRRTVVFSDRVEQLKLLRDILVKRHGMSLATVGLFTGSTKSGDRKVILENSQVILATYGVMSMGIDVPDLRAVIFATPLSDVAQSVGRVLRLCEGVKDPVVLDVVDTAYHDCVRWAGSRREYYTNTARARIVEVK